MNIVYTFVYCLDNISGCSCVYKYIRGCTPQYTLRRNVYINELAADALCIYKVGWLCIYSKGALTRGSRWHIWHTLDERLCFHRIQNPAM